MGDAGFISSTLPRSLRLTDLSCVTPISKGLGFRVPRRHRRIADTARGPPANVPPLLSRDERWDPAIETHKGRLSKSLESSRAASGTLQGTIVGVLRGSHLGP